MSAVAAAESKADQDGAGRQGQLSDSPQLGTSARPPDPSRPRTTTLHGRHEEEALRVAGQRLHVAHTVLLLLRMLQGYMAFQDAVPLLAAETARRAVDLLKASCC